VNTTAYNTNLLSGLSVVPPRRFSDSRGFFTELYNEFHPDTPDELRQSVGQVNISHSKKGVIRGMHFQIDPPQGKLLKVIHGKVQFVELDIRPWSPTFGQACKIIISSEDEDTLWVPFGFANGFQALEDSTLAYVCTGAYNSNTEKGISPFSPQILPLWEQILDKNGEILQILSQKDQNSPNFDEFLPFLTKNITKNA